MPTLIIKDLQKSFQQQPILKGIHLQAEKGEVIALLGKSGSGKSTLLRCINLLTIPDAGSLQVEQQIFNFDEGPANFSTQKMIDLRIKIGMVFQQFNLWPHKTVLQNLIAAPVMVLSQTKQQALQEAKILLEKMGLPDKQNHFPAQLSGGQQQRVAIARALMMKPNIMLFDEPTSALDPEMVGEVLAVMQTLAEEGMTMLIATHELNFAKQVATQCVFLEDGIIAEQGETKAMFRQAKTIRFTQFLKAMQH